jgi:hypothetical protein
MRGCSGHRPLDLVRLKVLPADAGFSVPHGAGDQVPRDLPADAGVFRRSSTSWCARPRPPRRRGGVPPLPRRWLSSLPTCGCSDSGRAGAVPADVLPADARVFRLRACPAPRYRGPPRHQLRSLPLVCRAQPPTGRRPRPAAEGIRPPDPMISSSRDITEKFRRREEGCDNAARGRICAVTWAFSIRLGAGHQSGFHSGVPRAHRRRPGWLARCWSGPWSGHARRALAGGRWVVIAVAPSLRAALVGGDLREQRAGDPLVRGLTVAGSSRGQGKTRRWLGR